MTERLRYKLIELAIGAALLAVCAYLSSGL